MGKFQELLAKLHIQQQVEESNKMNTENPVPVDSSKATDGSSGRVQSRVVKFGLIDKNRHKFGFLDKGNGDPDDGIFFHENDVDDGYIPEVGDLYEYEIRYHQRRAHQSVKGKGNRKEELDSLAEAGYSDAFSMGIYTRLA